MRAGGALILGQSEKNTTGCVRQTLWMESPFKSHTFTQSNLNSAAQQKLSNKLLNLIFTTFPTIPLSNLRKLFFKFLATLKVPASGPVLRPHR